MLKNIIFAYLTINLMSYLCIIIINLIKLSEMKKISFLTAIILIAFIGFFSGCETTKTGPTLQFFGGDYIDDDVTVEPGAILAFSWLATKGDGNLASFTIERDGSALTGYPDEDIPNDNYQGTKELEALSNEGVYVYKFTVTDNNDLSASESFNITVEQTGGPINTWTKTLGAHQSATGSSFASITGDVYQMDDAKAHSALIDFLYYYGANNHATLAAPDDATAATVFNNANNGLATWSTKNSTKFKTTSLTTAEFDAIANDLLITSNATGATDSYKKDLTEGNVIAFITDADKTGGSKMGLIKIVSIADEAAGTMEISVKVQQ
jgi:hypothetical protein